jgi:hypothetical protein
VLNFMIYQATIRYHSDVMEGTMEVIWQRDRLGGSEGLLAMHIGRVAICTQVLITRHTANHKPPPNAQFTSTPPICLHSVVIKALALIPNSFSDGMLQVTVHGMVRR